MNGIAKNLIIWTLIFLVVLTIFSSVTDKAGGHEVPFSDFLSQVSAGEVTKASIEGRDIYYVTSNNSHFVTYAPDYPDLINRLEKEGVKFEARRPDTSSQFIGSIIETIITIVIIVFVWLFIMNQMQGGGKGGGGAMGFGKSRAKLMTEHHGIVTFDDVAGIDEAKEELSEIVDFLKEPAKFQKLGGKIPKGVLLTGSPGTGKTLLARSIAGEAQVPFFSISGSDFVEMFVGVGASRVRDMFEQGRKNAPCIIFIDEIDAVGRHRGAGFGGGNDEREQTLNQLLVEMDGFDGHEGVIIVAATNRPDVLDPALLRPGRFDRQVVVQLPDVKGRELILGIHTRKTPLSPDVDLKVIARGTPGFAGADLANLVNEAALLAARRDKKVVTMQEMEDAKDKVMMGSERKSMVMSDQEKELTAYHEAGHALVGIHIPACDPIHKATIIPRGRALGMVMRLPEEDRLSVTREKLKADIAMAMGGRVAEEIIFGYEKVTSGASSDIQYATRMAKNMVASWGMSDKIGPVFHGDDNPEPFLGYSAGRGSAASEDTANLIDKETKILVQSGMDLANKILKEHIDDLHKLAKALLEYETLSGDEINDLLAGKDIKKNGKDEKKKSKTVKSSLPKTHRDEKDKKPAAKKPTKKTKKSEDTDKDGE